MVISTIIFFLGTIPLTIVVSRAIQGASITFTWVTGQVGEDDLGAYVGWTTVGVAIGEIVGPLVGGPIYDYLGHWAALGVVEALLFIDILLRVFAKEKKPGVNTATRPEQDMEADRLLQDGDARGTGSHRSIMSSLARDWLGTVFTLIVIFMVHGALEVVS